MQRLQIELIDSLGGNEFHRRAQDRFGNRFRVAEVVLLPLRIRPNVSRRHHPGIVTVGLQFSAQMMRANARLNVDQTPRYIREPPFHLASRPLLPQHDRAALVEADDVKRVLANIDAHRGKGGLGLVGHGDAPS
jgi:hypothetical protein